VIDAIHLTLTVSGIHGAVTVLPVAARFFEGQKIAFPCALPRSRWCSHDPAFYILLLAISAKISGKNIKIKYYL
jgi:hypothetical protein